MSKSMLVKDAKDLLESLKQQKKVLSASQAVQVSNQEQKCELNQIASTWFERFSKKLLPFGVDQSIITKYDCCFKTILKLSSNNSRRSSYEKQFEIILKSFNEEIVIFLQTDAVEPIEHTETELSNEAKKLLGKIPNVEENEYLLEAVGCWEHGYLKAAVVLVWCAAIDRIHRKIEQIGFGQFNSTSKLMKAQTTGRYKRFTKEFAIQSISELRMVFDNDILWVIEGMQLIDTNEKTRLSSCFDMRCHSGHPGAAPITKYNVLSCFSDIVEIVLANPTFAL